VTRSNEPSRECADFIERIVYLIDNELTESEGVEVRIHLDSCNPCLAKYDLQRAVKSLVARSCHETAPDSLREKVLFRLHQVQIEIREG
jgi:mycothiol system anti-sigma-R factor